jgi:hypothetical protein
MLFLLPKDVRYPYRTRALLTTILKGMVRSFILVQMALLLTIHTVQLTMVSYATMLTSGVIVHRTTAPTAQ